MELKWNRDELSNFILKSDTMQRKHLCRKNKYTITSVCFFWKFGNFLMIEKV